MYFVITRRFCFVDKCYDFVAEDGGDEGDTDESSEDTSVRKRRVVHKKVVRAAEED